jgi:uncharacterized protein
VARRPFVIGVTELRRRPGTQRDVHVAATLLGLAISSASVPSDSEIAFDGLMEGIEGGISATGTVTGRWSGECRRCLREVGGTLDADVREIFEPHPTEGETYPIQGDEVDLEPLVRDAMLLALPLAPLCSDDCAGPAPDVFPTGPDVPGDEAADGGEPTDPRWAALDELHFDED